ncbi:MAG TPA: ligase-associated DNA damage response exonuclease [Steroidobacteraceae bacterium]|nr:ligase-associated DNA damage response exonuclease [Steroidobacteraceae bacterium]
MTATPEPLVVCTHRGLYCPEGGFYIDPCRPVQTAVITHAHADHLIRGHARYILARPGAAIARTRLQGEPDVLALEYGAALALGRTTISLHPAGHILGSAQVRIQLEERVWVISGDYKRQYDPTCAAFQPLPCDVFVSEATFARPAYRWPGTAAEVDEVLRWWRANRERGITSVLFCYALGKAQRLLAELVPFIDEPVYVHDTMGQLIQDYRDAGVALPPTLPAFSQGTASYRGALVLAPPGAARTSWVRRLGEHASGFCSGWMRSESERRRRGYDRGFVISDHADWPALVATCLQTGARRVLLTHGRAEDLAQHLATRGVATSALAPHP